MKPKTLMKFFDLIPPALKAQAFIAGGACVEINYDYNSDVDFFILPAPALPLIEWEAQLRKTLNEWWPAFDTTHPLLFNVTPRDVPTDPVYPATARVLYDGHYLGHKFQIIASTMINIINLLETFDLSVHALALGADGSQYKAYCSTEPKEIIKVMNFVKPNSTLLRYRKLYQRYQPEGIDHAGLLQLIRQPDTAQEDDALILKAETTV